MADEMSGADSLGIHHGKGVLRHLRNRDLRTCGLALPHAAIVKGDAAEIGLERFGLWQPSVAMKARSLDKNGGFATSFDLPGERAAVRTDCTDQQSIIGSPEP